LHIGEKMERPTNLVRQYVNLKASLPYGLTVAEIEKGVAETYKIFSGINDFLSDAGYRPLEELILGNSFSGIVSEILVKNIAKCSNALEANVKIGGHPDLLPKGHYGTNQVLKGNEGIEVKCSIQKGGWQGHNPEESWVMIFRYAVGKQKNGTVVSLTFTEVLCAKLLKSDWSFSGRKGDSRRTPTASITKMGVEKLRGNFIYRIPGVGVGQYRNILANTSK
jgi:hypothetical protein